MLKFVTRGIRETLEKRVCRTNIYSQTTQENNTPSEIKKTSLACNKKFFGDNYSACKNKFDGSTKSEGTKDNNEGTKWNTKHNWVDAVSWSGALAVGWVVGQSLCFHRRIFNKDKYELFNFDISRLSQNRLSHLFNGILNLHPRNILPVTNCIDNPKKYITKENTKEIEANNKYAKPFGPITVEEAFNEAADEFNEINKLLMGEFELNYGIKALDEKRYNDALSHFSSGAKLSSPGSMFNLGLCHELGIGTFVDYAKAASYYDHAAKQGHADAMYNLGVFHAQGKGGLILDLDRARLYFTKAAELGHIQAQQALDLENIAEQSSSSSDDISISSSNDNYSLKVDYFDHEKTTDELYTKLNYNEQFHDEYNIKTSEYQNVEKTPNDTEILLNYLGLTETNLVSVRSHVDGCTVQC
ncbi:hypothetical protein M0802_012797 [Mischocyttarus mexicanus]|nr:hypothetical protein M0802_012797 [Mischocyttarus mexicanus]